MTVTYSRNSIFEDTAWCGDMGTSRGQVRRPVACSLSAFIRQRAGECSSGIARRISKPSDGLAGDCKFRAASVDLVRVMAGLCKISCVVGTKGHGLRAAGWKDCAPCMVWRRGYKSKAIRPSLALGHPKQLAIITYTLRPRRHHGRKRSLADFVRWYPHSRLSRSPPSPRPG